MGRLHLTVMHWLRTGYANLVSGGWPVILFVAIWSLAVVLPLLVLVLYSFLQTKGYRVEWEFSFDTWGRLFDSGRWIVVARTLRIAVTMTIIELVIAFPFAFWLSKGCKSAGVKAIILTLLTIPFFLDISSRTIVWRAILGSKGLISSTLLDLGVISNPIDWMIFSEFAVHFGMLAPYFPTMVLPIFLVLILVDDDYLDASRDLGASPLQTLFHVIFPLAMPGIIAGIVFTLVPTMAEYVVPVLMGGFMVNLLGNSVESALTALKYPVAAALSTFIVAILALLLAVLVFSTRRAGGLGSVFATLRR